jgi:hypothetical protein
VAPPKGALIAIDGLQMPAEAPGNPKARCSQFACSVGSDQQVERNARFEDGVWDFVIEVDCFRGEVCVGD